MIAAPFVGLRPGCLLLALGEHESLSFDGAGRWYTAQLGEAAYRRGLSNQVRGRRRGSRQGRLLAPAESVALWERIARALEQAAQGWRTGRLPAVDGARREQLDQALERALAWSPPRYAAESEAFRRAYGRVPILPPDQYQALYLQVNRGCTHNRCTFCSFYRGVPYRVLSDEEFARHTEQVRALVGEGLGLRRGLFLGDASALAVPQELLLRRIEQARAAFGDQPRVGAFAAVHDPARTPEEFAELRAAGLVRLTIGLESGSPAVRRRLCKPGGDTRIRRVIGAAHEGGLRLSLVLLAGIDGEEHVAETARMLERLELERGDIVYLSPLVGPLATGGATAQIEALRAAVAGLAGRPRCSVYQISGFVH